MNAFIGNHIRFIVEWGQLVALALMVLTALALYLTNRRFPYYLPRTFLSTAASLALVPTLLLSGLVFGRITAIKPNVATILAGLDALQDHPAPALPFRRVPTGAVQSLADFSGQVVLVNLWATWCLPCRSEMPELDRLQRGLADEGLVVLAVSDEDEDVLSRYLAGNPGAFVTGSAPAFDWVDMGGERPVTFLVDRSGIVREIFTGPWDEAFFREKVAAYL